MEIERKEDRRTKRVQIGYVVQRNGGQEAQVEDRVKRQQQ